MPSINKVILVGRLGKDPESKTTKSSTVTNFSVATSESWLKDGQKQEKTEWHKVVAWGKLADIAAKYLQKGSLVYVEGKLETTSYEDKDGNKKYTTQVRMTELKMLGGKSGGPSSSETSSAADMDMSDMDGFDFE